ncbi:MAG: ComEA family DNA-binding protein [Rhodopirellula sp. JB044]|uniref:ComEA family DNA-binding protein n=1 Tax=Rhodopirellula sp. JB044 TaxID=3342844 RepID=UPI00370B29D0
MSGDDSQHAVHEQARGQEQAQRQSQDQHAHGQNPLEKPVVRLALVLVAGVVAALTLPHLRDEQTTAPTSVPVAFASEPIELLTETPSALPRMSRQPGPARPERVRLMRIPLNVASDRELGLLPNVGPNMVTKIRRRRETCGGFLSVPELSQINGLGASTIEAIAPWCEIDQTHSPSYRAVIKTVPPVCHVTLDR